jgi:hypothetical protein
MLSQTVPFFASGRFFDYIFAAFWLVFRLTYTRNSDFEPVVVPKYEKDITEIEGKIIAMYCQRRYNFVGKRRLNNAGKCHPEWAQEVSGS